MAKSASRLVRATCGLGKLGMLGMLVALSGCAHRSTPTPVTSAPIANAVPPVFGYHVEIVARSAEVSELVVHAPCGAVTCERTARAMNQGGGGEDRPPQRRC